MKPPLFLLSLLLWMPLPAQAGDRSWNATYADGSANLYRFTPEPDGGGMVCEYDPVRPEESSTGHYSGGEPATARFDAKKVAVLKRWIAKLEDDLAIRAHDRGKGTGAFTVTDAGVERRFIVNRGVDLKEFERFLKRCGK
jgi:hypothetical protein